MKPENKEESMAHSKLELAFLAACDACRRNDLVALEPMLHENVMAFFIDDPLLPPICGKWRFLYYLQGKIAKDPDTNLDAPETNVHGDDRTGIVTGPADWHDDDEDDNGKKHHVQHPVKYRFHFTPDPPFQYDQPHPGGDAVDKWLLVAMYAER